MFGSLKHPSISDLDLVIVYDNYLSDSCVEKIVRRAKHFVASDENKRYIFTHDILIYPESLFRKIKFLHTLKDIRILSGKKVEILNPSDEQQHILDKVLYLDFTYNALFWIRNLRMKKKIKLRHLLMALNSVKHSLNFLGGIFFDSELIKWINALEVIREDFSTIDRISLLELERFLFEYLRKSSYIFLREWVEFPNLDRFYSKDIFVIYGRRIFRVPFLSILHGASYHKCIPEIAKSVYKRIHELMYPLSGFRIKNDVYRDILRIQMYVAMEFEDLYVKFRIRPLIPLMCNYCAPVLSGKQLLISVSYTHLTLPTN